LQTDISFGGLALLSKRVHISGPTLSTWRQKVQGDPAWRSSQRAYTALQRIFTHGQEEQLIPKIRAEFLDKAIYYCDEDFRIDTL
jgi:hypothetical protein